MSQQPDAMDGGGTSETQELARQASVELTMLLGTEQSLRVALQWMTRERGNRHKLATLRFHTWSFERQLARMRVLEDYGGYMHAVTDSAPHLATDVTTLHDERAALHRTLERIILDLEYVSKDDAELFERICANLTQLLDALHEHGQKESTLLQHAVTQEEGGSG